MLEVGSFRARSCQGMTRRSFVKAGLAAPFAALAAGSAVRAESARRARSVLLLWLWGAPSHLDTFDPKPNSPAEYRGPFGTIATRNPGVRFSELLPRWAARSGRFALIRSNRNFHCGHLEAGTLGLTGAANVEDGLAPNFGSVVARQSQRLRSNPGMRRAGSRQRPETGSLGTLTPPRSLCSGRSRDPARLRSADVVFTTSQLVSAALRTLGAGSGGPILGRPMVRRPGRVTRSRRFGCSRSETRNR